VSGSGRDLFREGKSYRANEFFCIWMKDKRVSFHRSSGLSKRKRFNVVEKARKAHLKTVKKRKEEHDKNSGTVDSIGGKTGDSNNWKNHREERDFTRKKNNGDMRNRNS